MNRTRKLRQSEIVSEDDFETYDHKRMTDFHAHCYLPQLALVEAKQFDETVALARHHPAYGDNE